MENMSLSHIEPYEGTQPYIFISYSHQDKALVFPILARPVMRKQ